MLKEQLLKDIERHLNAGNPQEHLPRLFCETLNWGSVDLPPFSIEVGQPVAQQLTVHHIAQLGGLPVFQINWHLDRPPTLTQRWALYRKRTGRKEPGISCRDPR